ncbi:MAG TPA: SpoIIE family protein phosphatase [Candidatus Limnocylindria bacterium]|nr:SpoIIE family protein phosphatase [Candidatus Limnocylindria bacterium]
MSGSVEARAERRALDAVPHIVWIANLDGLGEWFNERWYDYTGQTPQEALAGGYSRALHPDDLRSSTGTFRSAMESGRPYHHEHRLRGRDGVYRWHVAQARPLHDADGRVTSWIGTATDIDARRRAGDAMAFLADATEVLGAARDLDAAFGALAKLVVPALADWCLVHLVRDDLIVPHTIHHRDPVKRAFAWDVMRRYPARPLDPLDPLDPLLRRDVSYVPIVTPEVIARSASDERHAADLALLGFRSLVGVPLVARGNALGVLQLIRDGRRDPFAPGDRDLAVVLAQRAAVVLDNARIADRERQIARTFQEASLPRTLPRLDGLRLSVTYLACDRDAGIGGDWYDAFVLRDGRLVISIGDVAGNGVDAAVLMSSLRQAIRVAAFRALGPDEILTLTDEALANEAPERIATAFVGILDPCTWSLTYASAGHPPPILRTPEGALIALTTGGPPLGVGARTDVAHTIPAIAPGSVLVSYTDGLTEATHDIIEGERRLRELLRDDAVVHAANPARFVRDGVLEDGSRDDVAILVLGFGRDAHWAFDAEDAMAAHGARSSFVDYLRRHAEPASDFASAELIFGELVGNVVRYAPGPIDVAVEWNDERPVLHVLDRGAPFSVAAALPENVLSENGRGLFIVDALGEELSARRHPGRGNHVRVVLPVRHGGPRGT